MEASVIQIFQETNINENHSNISNRDNFRKNVILEFLKVNKNNNSSNQREKCYEFLKLKEENKYIDGYTLRC